MKIESIKGLGPVDDRAEYNPHPIAARTSTFRSQWAHALIRDTGHVLLDREMDPAAVAEIHEAVESDGDSRVCDLHVLRVGLNEFAVVLSVVTGEARSPEEYKERLRQHEELAHVTVEVNRCHEHEMAAVGGGPGNDCRVLAWLPFTKKTFNGAGS